MNSLHMPRRLPVNVISLFVTILVGSLVLLSGSPKIMSTSSALLSLPKGKQGGGIVGGYYG